MDPFVIGVDAHAKTHALAILSAPSGALIKEAQFPTTTAGLQRAIGWAARHTGVDMDALWLIEGVATYGAGLARAATDDVHRCRSCPHERSSQPRRRQVRPPRCPPDSPSRVAAR